MISFMKVYVARLIYANIFNVPNKEVEDIEVSNTHCFNFEY
jgi:hypothetical protein